jgi:hypothetical protein
MRSGFSGTVFRVTVTIAVCAMLGSPSARADDCPNPITALTSFFGDVGDRLWNWSLVAQIWKLDPKENSALLTPSGGERATSFGALIEPSCFAGLTPVQRRALKARLDAAVTAAVTQALRCQQAIGVPEIATAVSVLRRTRIGCDASKFDDGQSDKIALTTPGSINLNPARIKNYSVGDLAQVLFHEGLHSTPSGNRAWHNDVSSAGRTYGTCRQSQFMDRIYLLEAACFPANSSMMLSPLYSRAPDAFLSCQGACEATFTEVDAGVRDREGPFTATPVAVGQAQAWCGQIRALSARFLAFDDKRNALSAPIDAIRRTLPPPAPGSEATALSDIIGQALLLDPMSEFVENFHSRELVARFRAYRDHFNELGSKACAAHAKDGAWIAFCTAGLAQGLDALQSATALVEGLDASPASQDRLLLSGSRDSVWP